MASDSETEDSNFIEMILSNLFRKESNGDAIEFFVKWKRLGDSHNNPQFEDKLKKLKYQIEKCGGCLGDGPGGCHSIELVFPEDINNVDEIDSDIFNAEYIDECVKCGELIDLENFRLGKSPYSSIDINMIMQGHHSWDSVSRTSPQKGRKLPDFGPPSVKSPDSSRSSILDKKGRRVEYSIEEDLAIIKFLLAKNLYDKVGGNATWKIVHREFPNHSYQSLHNRFRRFILPNLSKYKGITNGERNLFNRVVSSGSSSVTSPKKTIQANTCSPIRNSPSKAENATRGVDQETVLASTSVTEKVSDGNPEEVVRNDADSGVVIQVSLNKLGESLLLRVDDADMEDNEPLTPNTMEMILCNLFRKESNGNAIDFYMRRNQFRRFEKSEELEEKCRKLKDQIEKCGGFLGDIPTSCHSIELVFPEVIGDIAEIESDVFNAEYVEACVKCGDLLDIENFRLGESPFNGSININSIMKGNDLWDSVTRKNPRKGRKLLDLGCSLEAVKEISPDKKIRNEYLMEEDLAILKFLVSRNLHVKVGRKATWKTVQREFPNHSFQSLQNRFSRHILPNLDKYESLTNSERNLFIRGSSTDDSSTSPSKPTLRSDTCASLHNKSQDNFPAADYNLNSEKEANNPVSIPAASELPKIVVDGSGRLADKMASDSVCSTVSSTKGKKTTRKSIREFTVEVDKSILKYIVTHKRYAEVFGTKLWMDIQATILQKRDWKSIKRRFHDVIVKNIESKEYSLDRNVILKLCSKKFSSSSEEQSSFDEDDCSASPYTKKRKSGPRPYSLKEDKLIIDYIVIEKRYEEIRGKRLWVDIQEKVLQKYDRTWESAKNRFLRTLYKNLQKFSLDPDTIAKFQHGAVVERHLGGVKNRRGSRKEDSNKNIRKAEESEEDPLPKHPALSSTRIATPAKKPKRQLFRQPIIPLPVIFTCEPGPVLTKKKDGSSRINATKLESAAATANGAENSTSPEAFTSVTTSPTRSAAKSPATSLTKSPTASPAKTAATTSQTSSVRVASSHSLTLPKKLRPAPSIRCEVLLKKLTKTELEKYGCKAISTQKIPSSPTCADSPVTIPSVTLPLDSPPNASRFTVEISPDLFAARLSAAGSSVSVVAQASQDSGWLPLASSLSRESLRHSSQPLTASGDNSYRTTAHGGLNKFQQPFSVTGASLNNENCEVNVESHDETDVFSQVSLSAKAKTCDPIRTKILTRSYLDLTKDDLSSDGYCTPEG